jgi:uncharacterized protein YbcI
VATSEELAPLQNADRDGDDPHAAALRAIAAAVVRIHKGAYGRGPERVRADLAGTDVLVCTAHGGLSPAERTMRDGGDAHVVEEARRATERAIQEPLCSFVASAMGRPVMAFLSAFDPHAEIGVRTFVLGGPDGDGGYA